MKKRLTILILLFFCLAAQADEFYFGAFSNQFLTLDNIMQTRAPLDSLKNMLGFNAFAAWHAWPEVMAIIGDSLKQIPMMHTGRGVMLNAYADYMKANYAVVEAEDVVHEVRFLKNTGQISNGFVFGPTANPGADSVFLDSLWYELDNTAGQYTYVLRLKVDTTLVTRGQGLGHFRIYGGGWWPAIKSDLLADYIIYADTFFNQHQEIVEMHFRPGKNMWDNYIQISTFQQVSFGIDSFKVYNQQGYDLIVRNFYVADMAAYAASYYQTGNVLLWYLRDEPLFTHWMPYKVVKDAIEAACPRTGNSVFNTWMDQSPRDFIDKVQPNLLWADPYPLRGGQTQAIDVYYSGDSVRTIALPRNNMTHYAGYYGPRADSFWVIGGDRGLQYDLDISYARELDSIYSAAKQSNLKMMITPQAWGEKKLDCEQHFDPGDSSYVYRYNDDWSARRPTRSELSCMTYIAMCYPMQGVIYWRYDAYCNLPNCQQTNPLSSCTREIHSGILEVCPTGNCPTPLWYEIHENIGPYVNTIGGLYVGLDHRQAYRIRPDSTVISGAWISSISATSNTNASNPDLGWFHVGEFSDTLSNKYVLIVNRACSQGENDPTEAPPVTAVVRFNTSNLNLGNIVYVIDLAKSQRHAGGDTGWVAIPDTTYSVRMSDGTLPFTTSLRAGEGRLYKIVSITNAENQLTKR